MENMHSVTPQLCHILSQCYTLYDTLCHTATFFHTSTLCVTVVPQATSTIYHLTLTTTTTITTTKDQTMTSKVSLEPQSQWTVSMQHDAYLCIKSQHSTLSSQLTHQILLLCLPGIRPYADLILDDMVGE